MNALKYSMLTFEERMALKLLYLNCINLNTNEYEKNRKFIDDCSGDYCCISRRLQSSKPKDKTPSGETEITVPCSGPDYFTNNKVFRGNLLEKAWIK